MDVIRRKPAVSTNAISVTHVGGVGELGESVAAVLSPSFDTANGRREGASILAGA